MCVYVGAERADILFADDGSKVCPGGLEVGLAEIVSRRFGLREWDGRVRVDFSGVQRAQVVGAQCAGDEHYTNQTIRATSFVTREQSLYVLNVIPHALEPAVFCRCAANLARSCFSRWMRDDMLSSI